jgi:hypothetical protein
MVPEVIAIDCKMTPKQIVDNLRLQFGVDVNENAARRAKATLLKKDTTSQREKCNRLPAAIDELQEANRTSPQGPQANPVFAQNLRRRN